MIYRYQGRDLFADPEGYNFADCAADAFLQGWKDYRSDMRRALLARADNAGAMPAVTQKDDADASSLITLLTGIRTGLADAAGDAERAEAVARLNKLVSKFEVFRRLFTHYDADQRKTQDAVPAANRHYISFAEVLALHVRQTGEARVLSTLLKLVDALVSLDAAAFSPDESRRLVAVIEAEARLVVHWETAVSVPRADTSLMAS